MTAVGVERNRNRPLTLILPWHENRSMHFRITQKVAGRLDLIRSAPQQGPDRNMRSRTTVELFQYWNDVRGDRDLPRRDEIQPADIRSLLPNVFILQGHADGSIHFRLAGTHICGLFGDELRHRQFSALWLSEQQEEAASIAGQVMKRCTPMLVAASGATATGECLEVEILLTPLASPDGTGDRVLGALSPLSRPMWLHMKPLQYLVLDDWRAVDAEPFPASERAATGGVTAIPNAYDRPIRETLHLRVFAGGRRN
ncbi:PAS domain-containing protein [Sinorhizobium arboris]|uniref:PAS domain-containing protein n=1 Tax=Sinorhizobium arboris TaxID=76745 RepID=UPI001F190E87|nr:PAS domain-containing protein [Sinorhizobium arboris]